MENNNLFINMLHGFRLDDKSIEILLNLGVIFEYENSYCFHGKIFCKKCNIDNTDYTLNLIKKIKDNNDYNYYLGFYKLVKINNLNEKCVKNDDIFLTDIMTINLKLFFPDNKKIKNGNTFNNLLSSDIKPKLMLISNNCHYSN
jgi:hypothetical protein